MLRFNKSIKNLEKVIESDLTRSQILERFDLQQAIVNSWDAFRKEIEMPGLFLIGQEIKPHGSVSDRIDILAYDSIESVLVVIELKRDKNKFQLLQGISYAAMVSSMKSETLIAIAQQQNVPEVDELVDILSAMSTLENSVRIILMAERFDPEVIITADWLYRNFEVDVSAFSIRSFSNEKELYLAFDQKYPLTELEEVFEQRTSGRRNNENSKNSNMTWDDVIKKLTYKWGKDLIHLCLKIKEGDPSRKRFISLRTKHDGLDAVSIFIRDSYANIYIVGEIEDAEEFLQKKFSEAISIGKWRDGYSFEVKTHSQYLDLVRWLKLDTQESKKNAA